MFSNILNSIPVVGHAKALTYYIAGDSRQGNEVMYEATRAGAVMIGGALGTIGGPAGMAVGGVVGGIFTDGVTSLLTSEPQGMVAAADNVCKDVANKENPLGSIFQGTLMVAADAVCGQGGGIVKNVAESLGKSTSKSVVKEIIKFQMKSKVKTQSIIGCTMLYNNCLRKEQKLRSQRKYYRKSKNDSKVSASGSGESPRDNDRNNKREHEVEEPEPTPFMIKFLAIFGVKSIDDIRFRAKSEDKYPFKGLTRKQKQTLKRLIRNLVSAGYLNIVIEIVAMLFSNMKPNDVSFINFVSLSQFIGTCVGEKVSESLDMDEFDRYYICQSITPIACDMHTLRKVCSTTWKDLLDKISNFSCDPYFRDNFAAAYHYYKHRMVPGTNIELSVDEYFYLINSMLKKLKTTRQYAELNSARTTAIYLEYYEEYNGTVKIVVKIQQDRIVLSSCHIIYGYWMLEEDTEVDD